MTTTDAPVVEREAIARIIDADASLPMWRQYNRSVWEGRWQQALAKADAILALTPVEGVGVREALSDAITEIVALREWIDRYAPHDLIASDDWGKLHKPLVTSTVLRNARAALSTPVAQGDEVRDLWSLEQRLTDGEFFSDYDEDLRLLGVLRRHITRLDATLTKGARDAG